MRVNKSLAYGKCSVNVVVKAHHGVWGQTGSHRSRFPLSTVLVRWSTPALSKVLILEKEGEGGGS